MLWRRALLGMAVVAGPLAAHGAAGRLLAEAELGAFSVGNWYGRAPDPASEPLEPWAEPALELSEQELVELVESEARRPSTVPQRKKSRAKVSEKGSDRPRRGIRVPESTVLQLARARAIPSAKPVKATAARPAGVQLFGVSSLGVGMRDGDVLTHVAGTPIRDKNEVVNLVLQARARRDQQISGRFFRDGEPWMLVVDVPYFDPTAQSFAPPGADR